LLSGGWSSAPGTWVDDDASVRDWEKARWKGEEKRVGLSMARWSIREEREAGVRRLQR
jgi:hypothetical protein